MLFKKKPLEKAQKLIDLLGVPCEYFPPMKNDRAIMVAYEELMGQKDLKGFTPVIVIVSDILINTIQENYAELGAAEYRKSAIAGSVKDPVKMFAARMQQRKDELIEQNWNDIVGEVTEMDKVDSFSSYYDIAAKKTAEVVIAKIPVANPYEVFAYVPCGGWNECPDTPDMIAAARRWYEKCGAMPVVIGFDTVEFSSKLLGSDSLALETAMEQFALCPDNVYQGYETVGNLAGALKKSSVWSFWWD